MSSALLDHRKQRPAAGVPTDPYSVTWAHACWASDPTWVNPGDGNPVDAWRNSTGGGNPANTGANRPTYRAYVRDLGKPGVEFVAANTQYLDIDVADIAQPFSVVIIAAITSTGGMAIGCGDGTASGRGMGRSSGQTRLSYGNAINGSGSSRARFYRGFVNGASSVVARDGTVLTTGNAGTLSFKRLAIGASVNSALAVSNPMDGQIAFIGVKAGDVTADAGWVDFKRFVRDFYGLVVNG